jgi:predicted aspartyl protease
MGLLLSALAWAGAGSMTAEAGEPAAQIAMTQSAGGTLYLNGRTAGVTAEFLLDTGAGMVTLSESTFAAIRHRAGVQHVRQMGARLANNRVQLMDVYRVEQFAVGSCELGPIEVAVMKGGSRNLLGLSALGVAAPFSIAMDPPSLSLSNCQPDAALAANF